MAQSEYGESWETPLIAIMCIVMVVSIVAVVALNKVVNTDCRAAEYTYCEPVKKSAPH
jgi:hypothetical protein